MKKNIIYLILVLITLAIPMATHAQNTNCAPIVNITGSRGNGTTDFVCKVEVGSGYANSRNVACGVSINGEWPNNYCPSDTNFGGWNGNTATFNCVLPTSDLITKANSIELVAYDFRSECGPQTGKRVTMYTKGQNTPTPVTSVTTGPSMTPGTTSITPGASTVPTPTSNPTPPNNDGLSDAEHFVDVLLDAFFGKKPTGIPPNNPNLSGTPTGPAGNGNITPTVPTGKYVYFSQLDPRYKDIKVWSSDGGCTFGFAGCGKATVAMILSSFVDSKYTPQFVTTAFWELESAATGRGGACQTWHADSIFLLRDVGGLQLGDSFDINQYDLTSGTKGEYMKNAIKNGWTFYVSATFTTSGNQELRHIFWVVDIDNNGDVWAYDPYFGDQKTPPINLSKDPSISKIYYRFILPIKTPERLIGTNLTPTSSQTFTPTINPGNPPAIDTSFASLRQMFEYIGSKTNVPARMLEAIAFIEYGTAFNYSANEIQQYSQPGNLIPNCPHNSCSAKGPAQMTVGVDNTGSTSCSQCCWNGTSCLTQCPNAWASYGDGVKKYDNATHIPDACNLRDAYFGMANKLFNDTKSFGTEWTEDRIIEATYRYFGNKTTIVKDGYTYPGYVLHYMGL